tara:strand:+ start:5598 stop:6689 length:1092 start_codon:yes stop_codon:yes gene_type:complete
MKLKKESNIPEGNHLGYTKEFDELGNLIFFDNGNYISVYKYDSKNRIIKETSRSFEDFGVASQKTETKYEYNNDGYRITTLRTQIIDDSYTTDKFNNQSTITVDEHSSEFHKDVNNILMIQEFTTKKNLIHSKKTTDFQNKKFYEEDYTYSNDLLIQEKKFEINKKDKSLIYEAKFEYDINNKLVKKIEEDILKGTHIILKIDYSENAVIENYIDGDCIDQIIKKYDYQGNLIKKNETQYIYIKEYNEKSHKEFISIKIEGEIIDNEFQLFNYTKFEYFNKNTIVGIKEKIGIKDFNFVNVKNNNQETTDWFRHWDNEKRIAVSIHKNLLNEIKDNNNLDGLDLQQELREGSKGSYTAYRIIK